MPKQVKPIPDGYHSVTPYLAVHDAARAIEFYQRAFGAKEIMRMQGPPGKIAHAELKIGDSMVMIADEMPNHKFPSPQRLGGSPVNIFLYVTDVDTVFNRAVAAGAEAEAPLSNMFWGDRYGKVKDPFGHSWSLATHVEDVAPQEMEARASKMMTSMGGQAGSAS